MLIARTARHHAEGKDHHSQDQGQSHRKEEEGYANRPSPPRVAIAADRRADPNAPKRGLSAYMFFANEQRENVREENPGISFGTCPFWLAARLIFSLAHGDAARCRSGR